jgi:ELWxxDGT repeat protein
LEDRLLLSFEPTLLKDTNLTPQGSGIKEVLSIGNVEYFTANDGVHGTELWRSDGTAAGTFLLHDINPAGDIEVDFPSNVNGTLVFLAGFHYPTTPNAQSWQIWRSDGTQAGTQHLLAQVVPPERMIIEPDFAPVNSFTVFGGRLFFEAATAPGTPFLPWVSDGTPAGTVPLKNISTIPDQHYFGFNLPSTAVLGGKVYFGATDGTGGGQLWVTDGTPAGTQKVKDTNPTDPQSEVDWPWAAGNLVYFFTLDHANHQELWRSDGTAAGTFALTAVSNDYYADIVIDAGDGTAYFTTYDNGWTLWHTDGTPAGTLALKTGVDRLFPGYSTWTVAGGVLYFPDANGVLWRSDGTQAGTFTLGAANATFLDTFGSTVIFSGTDGVHGQDLWRSNGSLPGTFVLKDIKPVAGTGTVVREGTVLYLTADDGVRGNELWKTDGTPAGTVLVADINPSAGSNPAFLTALGGSVFFTADDGTHGRELWRTDGTAAGTILVKDIFPGSGNSNPDNLVSVNGLLLFAATDPVHDHELWRSDGTAAGTVLVQDINPGTLGVSQTSLYDPGRFTGVGSTAYFVTFNGLYRTDGTPGGTVLVEQFQGQTSLTQPYYANLTNEAWRGPTMSAVGNRFFFTMDDGVHGPELWKTDGTPGNTQLVSDIRPGPAGSWPTELTSVNGTLFFTIDLGALGRELWASDGTAAGTRLVRDINPSGSSNPHDLVNDNGVLIFSADDGVHGYELWRSDGTYAGTYLVKDINPTGASLSQYGYNDFTVVNGTVFFVANDGTHGQELWKTDGTFAGTTLVADVSPGLYWTTFGQIAAANGTLYFEAFVTTGPSSQADGLWKTDGTAAGTVLIGPNLKAANLTEVSGLVYFTVGSDLWRSDGTAAGTVRITTVDANPGSMVNVAGTLFFAAEDQTYGRELWRSDGTTAGTLREDINPEGSSTPASLTAVGYNLFFTADDGLHGTEPWAQHIPTPNEKLVLRMYEDLLHRTADDAGLAGWSGLLDQGVSATDVTRGIERSSEYRTQVVDAFYETLLGRGLDAGGQAAALDYLAAGGTLEQIRNSILASPEYFASHGHGTDDGFLHALYQDLLGRGIDPVGLQNWQSLMAGGMSRATVVADIGGSGESLRHEVDQAYVQMLHRAADPCGESGWADYLAAGHDVDGLLAVLTSSSEYFQSAQAQPR